MIRHNPSRFFRIPLPERQQHPAYITYGLALLALLLLTYTIVRAFVLSMTADEAFSYVEYVRPGIVYPTEFNFMSANYHLLNVWGMWICDHLFGSSEGSLRIPNLVGHIFFLYFTLRFSLRSSNSVLAVAAFLLLNLHPYLLDFFSLARGYGLAIGLMSGGIFHALQFIDAPNRPVRSLRRAIVFFSLALMASFMLTYVFVWSSLLLGIAVLTGKIGRRKKILLLLKMSGIALFAIVLVVPIILHMKGAEALHWGSYSMSEMLQSLVQGMLYRTETYGPDVVREPPQWIVYVLLGVGVLALVLMIFGRTKQHKLRIGFLFLLLGLAVLATYVQHEKFGMMCPRRRTALYFVVLLLYLLITMADALPKKFFTGTVFIWLLLVPVLPHFFSKINFWKCCEWEFCAQTKDMMCWLKDHHPPLNDQRPVVMLGLENPHHHTVLYYIDRLDMHWLRTRMRLNDEPYKPVDYYLTDTPNRHYLPTGVRPVFDMSKVDYALFIDPSVNQPLRLLSSDAYYGGTDQQKLTLDKPNAPWFDIEVRDSVADSNFVKLVVRSEMNFPKPGMEYFFHISIHRGDKELLSHDMYGDVGFDHPKGSCPFGGTLLTPFALHRGDRISICEVTLGVDREPSIFGPLYVDLFAVNETK